MSHFFKNEITTKDLFIHLYEGVEMEEFQNAVDQIFTSSRYDLKDGAKANGTYERGSRIMRLLLGAFVKYFKYNVTCEPSETGGVRLSVVKETTGMSGGVVGMNQVKKESARLAEELKKL